MSLDDARDALIGALRRAGIRDERVLSAMREVPRERFVDPQQQDEAYANRAMPIGGGQTISQPYVVARMIELLDSRPGDRVLEVGGGSGYQAAVLSHLVAEVVSVELRRELADVAAERLRALGRTNVEFVHGDASAGYATHGRYDKIIVAAATPRVAPELVAQCAPGGRIVAPFGPRELQRLVVLHADGRMDLHEAVQFVPLLGPGGFGAV